jgi:hypothetical protein
MTGTLKTTLIQNPSSADVNITLGTAGQVTLAKSPVLNGSTSGTLTIAAAAVAGTNTITFPAATDTVATLAATQTLTNKTLTSPTITSAVITGTSVLTSATAQAQPASPSAVASVDFTGIPSYVKRITVMLNGVSGSATSNFLVQIGSGSIQNTGYVSSASAGTGVTSTAGFIITQSVTAATNQSGLITLVTLGSNVWVGNGVLAFSNASVGNTSGGNVTLGGTLDRLRITTVNGTDTFDAGSINIMYE